LPSPTVSSWTSGYFISADGNGCLLELHAYGTGFPGLNFRQARGTAAARAATQANDIIAFFGGAGYGTTSPTLGVAQARFVASQTFTDTSAPARVEFWTTPVGSTTIVEAARFNEAGNLLIGNTGGTDKLTVGGNAVPSSDNVYSCGKSAARWSAIWSATGTIQTSDARDKDIVERVSSTQAASIVDSVEPIKFRWKVGGYNEERTVLEDGLGADGQMTYRENVTYTPKAGARVHAGFIAQEIKTAMDANGGDFGAWGLEEAADGESRQFLRPDQLIAILWQALRVTRHELAELKAKIARP
jgi:hypothetical protein